MIVGVTVTLQELILVGIIVVLLVVDGGGGKLQFSGTKRKSIL